MSRSRRPSPHRIETYSDKTHRPVYGLVFVLPLLALYHLGTYFSGQGGLLAPHHIRRLLRFVGGDTWDLAPALAVVVVLLTQHFVQRCRWELHWAVLFGMLVESILATIPLIALGHVAHLVAASMTAATAPALPQGFEAVLQAVGAGLYEEFLFRLILISLLLLLLVDVFGIRRQISIPVAVVLSATLFSLYHFWPESAGETFRWDYFLWRTAAGSYLGLVFALRGFGVCVGTHVTWNLYSLIWRVAYPGG